MLCVPAVDILGESGQVAEGDLPPLLRRPGLGVPVCHGSGAGDSNPALQPPNLRPSTSGSASKMGRLKKMCPQETVTSHNFPSHTDLVTKESQMSEMSLSESGQI